ncbi:hypothetical protein J7I93_01450 [Bacillus sp. ISL-47]|uniref:Mur ligase family protein n=1 Tax=Bacillus sp. ISL-47 TaxID=2819130 RepID=UPI001BE6B80D|nr:Mur ligase family protein [Bacillus sp. ISL-47]MBT2686841.1 hypothetical protein [Bacillus sp. ISL-47]MBT2706806.1 hypothetical protein [Pseudomonas sp. ISL-84]
MLKFLEMDDQTDAAVIEMGLLKPGDVSLACKYFQPTIRILLNIDVYHLQGCKTMENYIKAKAEIMDGMKTEDLLIINADDHNIKKIDMSHVAQKMTFGIYEPADYMAKEMEQTDKGIRFMLVYKNKEYPALIPGYGKHNLYNALASIAAVHQIGLDIEEVIDKLSKFQHLESHLQLLPGIKGCLIIDDSWNNTPLAMEGALNVLKDTAKGKKIAALGSFPQIGRNQEAKEQYRYMASKVMEAKADKLIILDEKAKEIAVNARKMGMKPNDIHYCYTEHAVYKTLNPILDSNTAVLFKFSKILRKSLFKLIKSKIMK